MVENIQTSALPQFPVTKKTPANSVVVELSSCLPLPTPALTRCSSPIVYTLPVGSVDDKSKAGGTLQQDSTGSSPSVLSKTSSVAPQFQHTVSHSSTPATSANTSPVASSQTTDGQSNDCNQDDSLSNAALNRKKRKRPATCDPSSIRFERLRLTKLILDNEDYLVFEADTNGVLRRCRDNYINGTKLLNLTHVTKGQRDNLLRKSSSREVNTAGPRWLRGIWIPMDYAITLIKSMDLSNWFFPLLDKDPSRYFGQFLLLQPDNTFILKPMTKQELEANGEKLRQQHSNSTTQKSTANGQRRLKLPSSGMSEGVVDPMATVTGATAHAFNLHNAGNGPTLFAPIPVADPSTARAKGAQANGASSKPQQTTKTVSAPPKMTNNNRMKLVSGATTNNPIDSFIGRNSFFKQIVEDPVLPNIFTTVCPCSPQLITPKFVAKSPLNPDFYQNFWSNYAVTDLPSTSDSNPLLISYSKNFWPVSYAVDAVASGSEPNAHGNALMINLNSNANNEYVGQ